MKIMNLFYPILEIVGSLGACGFAIYHMYKLDSDVLGIAEVIFQLCLASVVIFELGIKGFTKGADDLKGVIAA